MKECCFSRNSVTKFLADRILFLYLHKVFTIVINKFIIKIINYFITSQ